MNVLFFVFVFSRDCSYFLLFLSPSLCIIQKRFFQIARSLAAIFYCSVYEFRYRCLLFHFIWTELNWIETFCKFFFNICTAAHTFRRDTETTKKVKSKLYFRACFQWFLSQDWKKGSRWLEKERWDRVSKAEKSVNGNLFSCHSNDTSLLYTKRPCESRHGGVVHALCV